MEQLNRSISKLKPPTKITSTATPSSTIATALAVAAAMGANENTATNNNFRNNNSNNNTAPTAVVTAGLKRKAEETRPNWVCQDNSSYYKNTPGSDSTARDYCYPCHYINLYSHSADRRKDCNICNLNKDKTLVPMIPKKKKRPAWDTKGRLEDMEELTAVLNEQLQTSSHNMKDLSNKLKSSEDQIAQLQSFRQNLESKVALKENENRTIFQKMRHVEQDLQTTARKNEEEIHSLRMQHSIHMDQLKMTQTRLKQEKDLLQSKLQSTNGQLESQMQENTSLRSTISTQSANCLALESDNRALKEKIQRTENTLEQRETTILMLERKLAESRKSVKDLDQRIREEETIRRRLHNTIQELKGNIRVFCRVRPVSSSVNASKNETATASITYPDIEGRQIEFAHATETATGSQVAKAYPFTFDRVFQPTSTQEDVFEEISQLVQSALDGYNVCIFAYGQTGSGKTHTMEGPLNASAESMGMIPRSVLQIYENAEALKARGWTYQMEGQYVEIYNETVNDLLGNDGLNGAKKHDIRHADGKTTITDITTVVLTSPEKVAALLKKAAHNRSVGSTLMNERSSRSHCVFTLRLSGKNSITDESSEGVLNLIDLAGSERLSQSGAKGDRLKETQAINKSLSALGDVISAIANPNANTHVPYRNSKEPLDHWLLDPAKFATLGAQATTHDTSKLKDSEESQNYLFFVPFGFLLLTPNFTHLL
ncbi:kinesin-like nuclear fusion protein [Linnemannia hyalina]|uniref:Kinesin-like protein n=1 Tax=Linnemannia hyalina TaxID=64524 RepID=A0A9P7Y4L6_9FUNG|nr:kinesin-like nuclear fusion protein [Linnemannia hyalina]